MMSVSICARELRPLWLLASLFAASQAQASVEISGNPTKHMRCSDGVCSPTDKNAVLNVSDLTAMLASSDVKVTTGKGAVTITVSSSFTWASANRLTLDANLNVSFRAPVEVAGPGGLTIVTNDGGTGGDLVIFPGASIDFWDTTSSLVVNGNNYTLVDSLPHLLSAIRANRSGFYALTKNYNAFKDKVYKKSLISKFDGTFEGLGHTISNLSINFSSTKKNLPTTAMFLASLGTIRDIGLLKANVTSDGSAAVLVGENSGTIMGAYVTGSVTAGTRDYTIAAGLVANNANGTIENCYSAASIGSGQLVKENTLGGLVGINGGTIVNSYSLGTVAGGRQSGGLVGENSGIITFSHSSSTLVPGFLGQASYAGGLVGWNDSDGTISQSYDDGKVSEGAGGLVGINAGTVAQSYAIGAVDGSIAGGLVEENYVGTISESYSTGTVRAGFGDGYEGGLIGYDNRAQSTSTSYWNTDTSGVTDLSKGAGNVPYDTGITGLTSAQLSNGLPAGFDPNIWGENAAINNGFPYLLANPPTQ